MVLDRIEQLEAKLNKFLGIPEVAELVAKHEQRQAEAHKEAQERVAAENEDRRKADIAANRQAAIDAAVRDGREPPKFEDEEQTDEAPEDGGQAQA